MSRKIHVFENGVRVYQDQLVPSQRERIQKRNVHEAEEEDFFIKLIQSVSPSACYVNVGSAIGYYPLLAKKISPNLTIHAVEPLDRHREYFLENIRLNDNDPLDFIIHTCGISSIEGFESFVDQGYGSLLLRGKTSKTGRNYSIETFLDPIFSRIGLKGLKKRSTKIINIKTITLDHLMNIIDQSVDLLQMDVQGLEVDVLNSGLHSLQSGSIKTFLIGTHGRGLHQDCITFLRECGYMIEFEEYETIEQPDGIIVAS